MVQRDVDSVCWYLHEMRQRSKTVKVYSEEGTSMTFTANVNDRVKKINEHIRAKTKVPVQDQVLLMGSKTLKPQRKLSSYGIDKETTIHLTLKVVKPSDEELPLFLVESGDEGQRHLLQVRRSSSVAQVKQMIETKTATMPEKQIVTCNGKRLEDGKTMADYGIRGGNLLFLTAHCIGGLGESLKATSPSLNLYIARVEGFALKHRNIS
ncbi:hypothetical protein GH733_017786 [Mirounga leonina]|nr:hypothetical protein GH733_017786 [Mirounga leonina]